MKLTQAFTLHKISTTNNTVGMDMTIITIRFGPPSSTNFVDEGENPSQQRRTLPVPQVPIRLTNVWCGRPSGIMDPLPF